MTAPRVGMVGTWLGCLSILCVFLRRFEYGVVRLCWNYTPTYDYWLKLLDELELLSDWLLWLLLDDDELTASPVDDELLELLDICRSATDSVTYNAPD